MNKTNLFQNTINLINLISSLSIVGGFMFQDFIIARIALYSFFMSYFIEIISDKKLKTFKFDKTSIYFISIILFLFLAISHFPFETSSEFRYILLERRFSLFGFGIVGLLGLNHLYKFKYFLYAFIGTSIVAIIYIFFHLDLFEFIHRPDRSEMFTNARILLVNSHMKFDFYLNISLISIWYLVKKHWQQLSAFKIALTIISIILIMFVLFQTEGRSGFIAGSLLLCSFIFIEIFNRWKALKYIAVIALPIILIGVISNQKRMSEEKIKREPRLFLWESAWNIFKQKPILGYGVSDAQAAFTIERIKNQDKEFEIYAQDKLILDCHNQYLQTSMEFGIIGLLLLIFIYIYPIFISDKKRKFFSIFAIFLCMFQSIFDMFITGTFSLLFGLLIIMILRMKTEDGFILNRYNSKLTNEIL